MTCYYCGEEEYLPTTHVCTVDSLKTMLDAAFELIEDLRVILREQHEEVEQLRTLKRVIGENHG